MKKIISLILCVMLVVGVFAVLPASVSAVRYYTLRDGYVAFYIYASSPDTTGTLTDVKASYIKKSAEDATPATPRYTYQWLDENNNVLAENQSLPADIKAASLGKQLKLKVSISSCTFKMENSDNDYYSIDFEYVEPGKLYPNILYTDRMGKSIHKSLQVGNTGYNRNTGCFELYYTFDTTYAPVNQVDINLPAPVDGEYPELYPSVPDGTELNAPVVWEDMNDHVYLAANALFKKGHTYSCEIQLKLKKCYYWADDPVFKINGNGVTAHPWYSGSDYGDYYKYKITYKFPPAAAKSYNLWLGDTQVTDDNRSDILGDGKAKFDPATNNLTLNKATISGSHTGADGNAASIYAEGMDLTVKGSGTIGNDNVGIGICQYNSDLTTNYSLTLDGNFTFKGEYGVFTVGSLTVDGGSVISTGTVMSFGDCKVNAGVSRLEASGDNGTFGSFGGKLILDPSLKIIVPENGQVKEWGIVDANGQFVTHVVIRGESETYIRGDVDKSGKVNVFDASYILKGTTGTKDYPDYKTMDKSSVEFKRADVDGSGTVNIFDAAIVLKHATGDKSVAKYGVGEEVSV